MNPEEWQNFLDKNCKDHKIHRYYNDILKDWKKDREELSQKLLVQSLIK